MRAAIETFWNDIKRAQFIDAQTRALTLTMDVRPSHMTAPAMAILAYCGYMCMHLCMHMHMLHMHMCMCMCMYCGSTYCGYTCRGYTYRGPVGILRVRP